MGKAIDKTIGVSRTGYIAKRNGKLVASSTTLLGLANIKIVRKLIGNGSLTIGHVVPKGTIRIY